MTTNGVHMKKEYSKIVSIIPTTFDGYIVCFQLFSTIEDTCNPYHGQHKMATLTCDKTMIKALAKIWGVTSISKLIGKDAELTLANDGSIFGKVIKVKREEVFSFRTQPQALPKWITNYAKDMTTGTGICWLQ